MGRMSCFDRGIYFLSRRDHAQKELTKKLHEKGYENDEVTDAITRLQELNYLDDAKFAASWVRYRAELSGWGKKRISIDLQQKGVAPHLIDMAIKTWEEDESNTLTWCDSALLLLNKRFKKWECLDQKERTRRVNFLLRRGFSIDEALKALENLQV